MLDEKRGTLPESVPLLMSEGLRLAFQKSDYDAMSYSVSLKYDELNAMINNFENTCRRVLVFLDIPIPLDFHHVPPLRRKQRDKISEEWYHRYIAELHQRYGKQEAAGNSFTLTCKSLFKLGLKKLSVFIRNGKI